MKHIGVCIPLVLALAVAPPALAQGPPLDTYGGAGGVVGDVEAGAPPAVPGAQGAPGAPPGGVLGDVVPGAGGPADGAPAGEGGVAGEIAEGRPGEAAGAPAAGVTAPGAADQGRLPFTGLDVALMLAGGLLLLGLGVSVRKFSRPMA